MSRALRFDCRSRWFAAGRSALALATASELVFTGHRALFVPVSGIAGPLCVARPRVSLFCLGGPHAFADMRCWLAVAGLLVVASGIRPRSTAVLHLWIVYSITTSVTLPDGGDSIALIVVLLITPMCLTDSRRWQWSAPQRRVARPARPIVYASFWALRLQIAFIYADSAVAKMGVPDWQNGSAFYYFVRDKMFGAAGPTAPIWQWLSAQAITTLAITWGTIALELAIALFTLLGWRWRLAAFWLCTVLHVLIFFSMGLFSFSAVMVAVAALVATPNSAIGAGASDRAARRGPREHNDGDRQMPAEK